jgi:hypothetical protein
MQIFKAITFGYVLEILDERPIHELLDTNEVYILINDIDHEIYLWVGKHSRIRERVVGEFVVGLWLSKVDQNYRNVVIEEEDHNAGKYLDFIVLIQQYRTDGNFCGIDNRGALLTDRA